MQAPTSNAPSNLVDEVADHDSKQLDDLFEKYKARRASSRRLSNGSSSKGSSSSNKTSSQRTSSTRSSSMTSSSTGRHSSSRSSSSMRRRSLTKLSEQETTSDDSNDLKRAASFITQEQLKLERRARDLLKEILDFSKQLTTTERETKLADFLEQTQDIAKASLEVKRFALEIDRDEQATSRLSKTPWSYITGGTKIITILSDAYDLLRSIQKDGGSSNCTQWVAPSSFERYTHKYWVNEDYLSDLMLSCVTEVPMLVYGKSGLLTDDLNVEKDRKISKSDMRDIWDTMTTPITSIYFDSPNMYLYEHRIARNEGAKLFRVRWYGDKPKGDELVFLELKTHHEQWIADKSVKQRVNLRERDMSKLLARDGAKWDRVFTEELVLAANPKLKGDDLQEAVQLLHQMRKLIIKRDLRPCVRTRYLRMAFQSAESNALRLTIDRNITMIDESSALLGEWSLPEEAMQTAETVRVPCAVFEVKLAGSDNPAFMERLLETGVLQDGHKFSKFLTGAATFHGETINTFPYWARLPMFKGMFGIEDFDKIESSFRLNKSQKITKSITTAVTDTTESAPLDGESSSRRSSLDSQTGLQRRGSALSMFSFPRGSLVESVITSSAGSKKVAPKKQARVEPKTYFASERTYIQWISAALLLVTISTLLLGFASEEGQGAPRVMGLTLIFTALFITVYSVFVYFRRLHLLTNGLPYGYADHAGPVILTSAVLMGIVALLYYTFTTTGASSQPVGDRIATMDSSGQCIRHGFSGVSLLKYEPSDAVLMETSQTLIIPSKSKLTGLSLAVDTGNTQDIRILGEVLNADIEAIAFANGVLYAVSESKESSTLYSLQPQYDGERIRSFQQLSQWKLKGRGFTEGMAYVPDENGGKLYVSDNNEDALAPLTNVFIYDIPLPSNFEDEETEIFPLDQLNGKILSQGIAEMPKIGAMTFFEDRLYILHDNARVVRGWDLISGTMVSEWTLPRVEGGFHQQWEGLSLQRVATEAHNMFRGGRSITSSALVLHLTLDTPPQVWSFQLQEVEENVYVLPECAAAF